MPDTRPIEALMLDALIDRLLHLHPLPWKADSDWLPEVIAKDGATIAESITEKGLAQKIVAYAEARHAHKQQAITVSDVEIEQLMLEVLGPRRFKGDSMDDAFGREDED